MSLSSPTVTFDAARSFSTVDEHPPAPSPAHQRRTQR